MPAPALAEPALPAVANDRSLCRERLQAAGHAVEPAAQPTSGNRELACAIANPVRVSSLSLNGGGQAAKLPDAPLVDCALAESLAEWTRGIVAPVLQARFGSPLATIRTGPGFECRGRNRQVGGKPSAHGRGLAVDIAAFVLADGKVLPISALPKLGDPSTKAEPGASLQALRVSACGWFTTVLGPGSDAFHGDHLHVDLERHGSSDRYRICQ